MSPDLIWGGVAALVLFLEMVGIFGKTKDDTISEQTRKWFKTETPLGAAGFTVAWLGFAAWFLYHIVWDVPYRKLRRP